MIKNKLSLLICLALLIGIIFYLNLKIDIEYNLFAVINYKPLL